MQDIARRTGVDGPEAAANARALDYGACVFPDHNTRLRLLQSVALQRLNCFLGLAVDASPVVLINVFTLDKADEQGYLQAWKEWAEEPRCPRSDRRGRRAEGERLTNA